MGNPLLAPAGSRINPDTGELLDEEERKRERERERAQEEDNPAPLAMGLLQLGASMMRDEGWRDRPITLGESLGKAIPRGIAGYYNQDALNRQHEGEANEQRMLEEQAEVTRLKGIDAQDEKVRRFKEFSRNVDSIPDKAFSVGGGAQAASNRRENLKQMFLDKPEDAMKALEKIYETQAAIENRAPTKKTRTDMLGEKDDAQLEEIKKLLPSLVYQVMEDPDVSQEDKDAFAFMYGKPDYLSPEQLRGAIGEASKLTSAAKAKDHSIEFKRHYDWLKKDENWKTFCMTKYSRSQMLSNIQDSS